MNKLYAFWKYDIFPKILSGTVKRVDEKGYVLTHEYGNGMWFKARKIVAYKAGITIRKKLDDLEARYRVANEALYKKFEDERDGIIKL